MNTKVEHYAWTLVIFAIGGLAGYYLHPDGASALVMPANATPALDYLIAPESYSRVHNTKATLAGLSLQMRIQSESGLLANSKLRPGTASEGGVEKYLRQLELGVHEFAGTEQELEFLQDMLLALKSAGRFEQWTDVYLRTLYQHPTHQVIAQFAAEAISIGKAAGRDKAVLAALSHVAGIPVEFDGKEKIAAVLMEAGRPELTTHGSSPGSPDHPGS
jgi:hypothetical protein